MRQGEIYLGMVAYCGPDGSGKPYLRTGRRKNPDDLSIFRGLRGVLKNPPVASCNVYRARGAGRVARIFKTLAFCALPANQPADEKPHPVVTGYCILVVCDYHSLNPKPKKKGTESLKIRR